MLAGWYGHEEEWDGMDYNDFNGGSGQSSLYHLRVVWRAVLLLNMTIKHR